MRLFLMRHGPAEEVSATGRDRDRRLTPTGEERVRMVARAFLGQNGQNEDSTPTSLLTSPYARAHETAQIVQLEAERLGRPLPLEVRDALAPGSPVDAVIDGLVAAGQRGAVLVGHEPDLSDVVSSYCGRSIEVTKSMVVALDLSHPGRAAVAYVLDPETLVVRR